MTPDVLGAVQRPPEHAEIGAGEPACYVCAGQLDVQRVRDDRFPGGRRWLCRQCRKNWWGCSS